MARISRFAGNSCQIMGCADTETARTCPHISVRYALIAAYLYAGNELSGTRAKAFVPRIPSDTRPARGRPPGELPGTHQGPKGQPTTTAPAFTRNDRDRRASQLERSGIPCRCDEMLSNMLDNIIDVGPGRGYCRRHGDHPSALARS
jgi:hypothetical protein